MMTILMGSNNPIFHQKNSEKKPKKANGEDSYRDNRLMNKRIFVGYDPKQRKRNTRYYTQEQQTRSL
jgi:hypothetical protein